MRFTVNRWCARRKCKFHNQINFVCLFDQRSIALAVLYCTRWPNKHTDICQWRGIIADAKTHFGFLATGVSELLLVMGYVTYWEWLVSKISLNKNMCRRSVWIDFITFSLTLEYSEWSSKMNLYLDIVQWDYIIIILA